ncbi:MAG: hypothetical protein ACW9WZ_01170 [Nitrosopumilus sp.]
MAENSDDYFETLSKVFQKNFSETEYFVPHFQQTLFDLQNESYKAMKDAFFHNYNINRNYYKKIGFSDDTFKILAQIFELQSEEYFKFRKNIHNNIISVLEFYKNSFKLWNSNSSTLFEFQKKFFENSND